jgi:hypothetical protein
MLVTATVPPRSRHGARFLAILSVIMGVSPRSPRFFPHIGAIYWKHRGDRGEMGVFELKMAPKCPPWRKRGGTVAVARRPGCHCPGVSRRYPPSGGPAAGWRLFSGTYTGHRKRLAALRAVGVGLPRMYATSFRQACGQLGPWHSCPGRAQVDASYRRPLSSLLPRGCCGDTETAVCRVCDLSFGRSGVRAARPRGLHPMAPRRPKHTPIGGHLL